VCLFLCEQEDSLVGSFPGGKGYLWDTASSVKETTRRLNAPNARQFKRMMLLNTRLNLLITKVQDISLQDGKERTKTFVIAKLYKSIFLSSCIYEIITEIRFMSITPY
jgi:hypothetical protein